MQDAIFLQKAKDLVKSLYSDKAISFKEVSNIYHENINFIIQLALNNDARMFYIAIDRIYLRKLVEFNLLNGKTEKTKTSKNNNEKDHINSLL